MKFVNLQKADDGTVICVNPLLVEAFWAVEHGTHSSVILKTATGTHEVKAQLNEVFTKFNEAVSGPAQPAPSFRG